MWQFLATGCLILCNSFFTLVELSLITAKKPRLLVMADEGVKNAKIACDLARRPDYIIATVQIGLTVIMLIEGAVTDDLLAPLVHAIVLQISFLQPLDHIITIILSFALVAGLTILFGDIIPKRIALAHPEAISISLAPITSKIIVVASPLVNIFAYLSDKILGLAGIPLHKEKYVSAEDIEDLFEVGAQSGLLAKTEKDLLDNVWRMDELQVSALMTPRSEIVYIDITASDEENLEIILNNPSKQIIVCNENLDHVLGFGPAGKWLKNIVNQLSAKIEKPKIIWSDNLLPIHAIPNSLSLIETLDSFRKYKTHIALVYNEFGHVEGIISIYDLMSAIVGEYPGGDSDNLLIVKDVNDKWLIDGMAPIHDVKSALEIEEFPNEDIGHYNTAAGLTLSILGRSNGRLPKELDSFNYAGYTFEVIGIDRTQGYRIDRLKVYRESDSAITQDE